MGALQRRSDERRRLQMLGHASLDALNRRVDVIVRHRASSRVVARSHRSGNASCRSEAT